MRYLVWSWRKRQWHASDFQGYTDNVDSAGRFLMSRACVFAVDGSLPGANVVVPESMVTPALRENAAETLELWRVL